MALFNKKKTEETKKEAVKAPATEKKGPSIHNVKVPAAKAETKPVETKPAPAKAPAASKVVAKPAPAKAAAPAAPAAPAAKAPAAKPAAPAKKTVPASKVPEGVTVVSRPFFMKTEEDVKLAFDQAIAEADAAGLTIMTLEEFLTKYKEARDFKLLLEIKNDGEVANQVADRVYQTLKSEEYSWWFDRTMIITFTDSLVDYIIDTYEDLYVGPLGYKIAPQLILNAVGLGSLYNAK